MEAMHDDINKKQNGSMNFIDNLLKESDLSLEYFDIFFADKIQPDMYEILKDKIEYINNLLSVNIEKKRGLSDIKDYKQIFGFAELNESLIFYCQDNKKEIFNKTGMTLVERMKSYGIPLDRITFNSQTQTSKSNKKSKTISSKENDYDEAKNYEILSIERFNYTTNLKDNLIGLVPMPNVIFYLLPFNKMNEVKEYLNMQNNNIINELNYKTDYFGFNELDGIFMNDINKERKIEFFKYYEIRALFKVYKKNIEVIKSENIIIRPYSINFIEVKSSFNYLKSQKQVFNFIKKCLRFVQIFQKLKLNIIEKPKSYDEMEDEAGFPKVLCFDLFFIVDNSDRDFDKYIEEIKIQIKDFLQKEDLSFNFQLIFSSKKISNYDLFAIHKSRIENMNSLSLNSNKIQKEILTLKNEILNLKMGQDKTNKIIILLIFLIIVIMIVILIILFYFLFQKK